MPEQYEFRIDGTLSSDLLRSFSAEHSSTDGRQTVFVRGIRDQAELYGVVARCETLGLRLTGLRRAGGATVPNGGGSFGDAVT